MFDDVPVRVWLLIAIGFAGFGAARYVYDYIAASPSRRDITRPAQDLSWRQSERFYLCLTALAFLGGLAIFIFTPAAEALAQSPRFVPLLCLGVGGWALVTVILSLRSGVAEPAIRGMTATYDRAVQPKRYWASLIWNGFLGCLLIWLAYRINEDASEQMLRDRCFDEKSAFSTVENRSACDELIREYDSAISGDPGDAWLHYQRGLVFRHLGDLDSAIAGHTEALRLQPDLGDAYFDRGRAYLNNNQLDRAVADFSKAHEYAPESPWPLANRGITYAWKNDRSLAEADFRAVRAIDPSNQVVLRGEALLALQAGDLQLAVRWLTEALNREPGDQWSLAMRADAYRQLGDAQKAQADADMLGNLRAGD